MRTAAAGCRLWGVLLCGMLNTLLWERGDLLFTDVRSLLMTIALIALAAGFATPREPTFTTLALCIGSPLIFGHSPIAMGLLPFYAVSTPNASWMDRVTS